MKGVSAHAHRRGRRLAAAADTAAATTQQTGRLGATKTGQRVGVRGGQVVRRGRRQGVSVAKEARAGGPGRVMMMRVMTAKMGQRRTGGAGYRRAVGTVSR